jgi:TonB family protein
VREIKVDFPEQEEKHDVLATLWARKRIEELSSGERISDEQKQKELEQTITNLSLEFRLLTNYTSFVAVEDIIRTEGGKSVKVEVPVERANGTFGEGFKPASDPHGFIMQGFAGGRNTSPAAMANTPPRINSLTLSMKSAPPPPPPTRLSGSAPKRISGGVVNGKAVSLPAPQYPAAARAASAKGSVNVLVTIDESGNVISATPVSGHPLFRAAAATAAKRAKFAPTMMSGKPVQVSGVIVYNFGGGSPVGVANSSNNPLATVNANENESIEEETVKESPFTKALKQKLHKWVYELFNRLQTGATKATPNESKFARNGKARLQIRLSKKSIETIDKLKDLGLENIKETGKDMIEGEIDIQKIADLIEIGDVQYILPKIK